MFEESILGYGKHNMDSFVFESGKVLEDVWTEYTTKGTPKFDEEGNIVNAVLCFHKFNGSYSSIESFYKLSREGAPFDKNEFFFISPSVLGSPESCSPSTTKLRHHFPKYTVNDVVNFVKQFVYDKFKIKKLLGVCGEGYGGYCAFTWACEYPDELDFLIILNSSCKTNGYRYIVSRAAESLIESSDDFYGDIYSDSLSRIMVSINKLMYSNYFSKKVFQSLSIHEIDVLMDDFVDDGLFFDIYDFKYRNDSMIMFDVEDKLKNIRAKTLIISVDDDYYYVPELDIFPLKDKIEDCRILLFESKRDYLNEEDFSEIEDDIGDFLEEFKK